MSEPPLLGTVRFEDFPHLPPIQPLPPDGRRQTFLRDEAYEASPGVAQALRAVDGGSPAILILGRAGTGKTRLVKYLKERPGGERQAVVAPTGIAALNAEAQTIHSLFRLPPHVLDAKNLADSAPSGALFNHMQRLVIDEISMVRADMLDAIDRRLRQMRRDPRPFGGVQLVMVGDFLQLPPVVRDEDQPLLNGLGYRGPYAFNAHAFKEVEVTPVILDTVYRQDEQEFIEILERIREGCDIARCISVLNARCNGRHRAGAIPLILTPTRGAADRHNQSNLDALRSENKVFTGVIEGRFNIARDMLPVPEKIDLRTGARVMAAKNDLGRRWVNGSLGTVTRISKDGVTVRFDSSGEQHLVPPASWGRVRQGWNAAQGRIENAVEGTYTQIPLNLAWAATIHKAQGLTLDDARIDLGGGAFAPGQTYVALSRCRSLAGLSLAQPLQAGDILVEPMLLKFMAWLSKRPKSEQ